MFRQYYLNPCVRVSEAMFCVFEKLLKLQVHTAQAREGRTINPKTRACACVHTDVCFGACTRPAPRHADAYTYTQACFTDASGALSFKESKE